MLLNITWLWLWPSPPKRKIAELDWHRREHLWWWWVGSSWHKAKQTVGRNYQQGISPGISTAINNQKGGGKWFYTDGNCRKTKGRQATCVEQTQLSTSLIGIYNYMAEMIVQTRSITGYRKERHESGRKHPLVATKHAGTSANNSPEPGIAGRWRFFTGKEHSVHAPSLVLSLVIHYQVLQATECNKPAIPIWIGHYELQRRRNQTPESKVEYRTALKQRFTVNKQKPAEKPFSLFLDVLIMQQSFQKMQAAYEIIWRRRANTTWSSHGWRWERTGNEFTPTQPTKQLKVAGMY